MCYGLYCKYENRQTGDCRLNGKLIPKDAACREDEQEIEELDDVSEDAEEFGYIEESLMAYEDNTTLDSIMKTVINNRE